MVDLKYFSCSHGGDSDTCFECQQILGILAESDQVTLRDPKMRQYSENQEAQQFVPRATRADRHEAIRENLAAVFRSDETIETAVRLGFMTHRQGRVVSQVLWDWDQSATWTANCQWIGNCQGCSRTTVSREIGRIANSVCRLAPTATFGSVGVYRVTKDRGSRQRRVWKVRRQRVGQRSRSSAELVTDPTRRREVLRERLLPRDALLVPIKSSTMRRLLNALAEDFCGCEAGAGAREIMMSPDWDHNVKWRDRQIQTARRKEQPTKFRDVAQLLVRRSPLCRACRTSILVGCRIDGHRINRGREFCNHRCQMEFERRRRRLQPVPTASSSNS